MDCNSLGHGIRKKLVMRCYRLNSFSALRPLIRAWVSEGNAFHYDLVYEMKHAFLAMDKDGIIDEGFGKDANG